METASGQVLLSGVAAPYRELERAMNRDESRLFTPPGDAARGDICDAEAATAAAGHRLPV